MMKWFGTYCCILYSLFCFENFLPFMQERAGVRRFLENA